MQSQSKQRKIRDFKLNGYDRPSKAIDWLMKEAKPAIDALGDDHRDHDLLTTVIDTSEAFRGTDVAVAGRYEFQRERRDIRIL
ncbi:hypothetical protein L2E82_28098 [Cichorium intybus]|uniref:Uncharacterized protein n=1 Tax=Cichorium intybus TaxID=13427 RepID=A0ACB9CV38_CICIN|nr:hypothetical protein L2E82_28098 [Cichorium intybus]